MAAVRTQLEQVLPAAAQGGGRGHHHGGCGPPCLAFAIATEEGAEERGGRWRRKAKDAVVGQAPLPNELASLIECYRGQKGPCFAFKS